MSTPSIQASPDGSFWFIELCQGAFSGKLLRQSDGQSVLNDMPIVGGGSSVAQMRVDATGDPWIIAISTTALHRYGQESHQIEEVAQFPGFIWQWAFGATGEEIFAVYNVNVEPYPRRLARLNRRTGLVSSIPLTPEPFYSGYLATGDPTGFIFANVIDRDGDNDGDGASNGAETAAGSHPFDPNSRPGGPKIDVSFLHSNNAIRLWFEDPDGLLDPTGGIDPASISVIADGYGDILPILLSFVTNVTIDPSGNTGSVTFGGLAIPDHLKLGIEVSCRDHTGLVGWDWQITPPGEK